MKNNFLKIFSGLFFVFLFLFFAGEKVEAGTIVYDTTSALTIPGAQVPYSMNFNATIPSSATVSLEIKWLSVGDNDNRDFLMCGGSVLYTTGNSPGYIMPPYPKTVTTDVSSCLRGYNLSTGNRICTANAWNMSCGGFFYGLASGHSTIEYAKLTVTYVDGPPVVSSFSPADNASASGINDNLVINFDRPTTVHSGNVIIKKTSDNSTIETIDVSSGQVTGSGTSTITINPSVTLDGDTGYYVQIDATAFSDGLGNYYTGISNTTSWNFTTIDLIAPTSQANNIIFSSVLVDRMTASWTNGNGDSRIVFAKQASTGTTLPVDGTNYTASATFGSGTQIGTTGWYAVYKGTGTSVTVTNLSPGTDHIFQVFEYDLSGTSPLFLTSTTSNNPNVQTSDVLVEPTVQATNLVFSSVAYTSETVSWTNGNGDSRVVFAKQASEGTATPVDNTNYTASATFGSGTQIGSTGWYCVYKGTGTSVAVTGLTVETDYIFQVFEYDNSGAYYDYNASTSANNPLSQATASVVEPTTQASSITFSSVSNVSALVSWTNGNGDSRIVFAKQASAGTTLPVDGTNYTASATFGSGTQIGTTGWYAVYKGTGTSVTVVGLSTETDYIFQVFEYNSSGAIINFLTDVATDNPASQTTTEAPSEVTIGSGTSLTSSSGPAPINIWYRSLHGQSVYTASELNAAGLFGPATITKVGFYVNSAPAYALSNFVIRMKHTTDSSVANWQAVSGMTTAYSTSSYAPTAGDFDLITLATPFEWNGADNIVIDTAFGLVSYSQSGIVRYYDSTNGYRYSRSDSSDQTNIFSGGSVSSAKPQIKLAYNEADTTAPTITSISSNKNNGAYKVGEVIDIDVNFSEEVTGDVTITLETGDTDRTCTFTVSNETSGTCNYTVEVGDTSSDLDATISGDISDQADNAMSNFTPTTTLASSKNIVIDTTAPETPVANPESGTYNLVQSVSLSSSGSSAIYYTLDGSEPTISSTLYDSEIEINNSLTLKVLAVDLAGNESSVFSANYVINLDSDDPIIDNISVVPTANSALITWETDENSSSQVEYGLTNNLGEETVESDTGGNRTTNHEVELTDLQSCAMYYYAVKSKDDADNLATSNSATFFTSGCDASEISTGSSESISTSGESVSLETNAGTAQIIAPENFYSETVIIQINKLVSLSAPEAPLGTNLIQDNFFDLLAIKNNGELVEEFSEPVSFVVFYGSGVEASFDENTLDVYKYENGGWTDKNCVLDTDANTLTCALSNFSTYGIFGIQIAEASSEENEDENENDEEEVKIEKVEYFSNQNSITVRWETNVYADSKVKVGLKKNNLRDSETEEKKEKKHKIILSNLEPDTKYYFRIYSNDGDDNRDSSKFYSTKTLATNDLTLENEKEILLQSYEGDVSPKVCSYVVEDGDNLWTIAKKVYGDATAYPLIVEVNKEKYPKIAEGKLKIGQEFILACEKEKKEENKKDIIINDSKEESKTSNFKWWNPLTWVE